MPNELKINWLARFKINYISRIFASPIYCIALCTNMCVIFNFAVTVRDTFFIYILVKMKMLSFI